MSEICLPHDRIELLRSTQIRVEELLESVEGRADLAKSREELERLFAALEAPIEVGRLAVTLEGGLVQEVLSDTVGLVGVEVTIVDKDIEAPEEELVVVHNLDGSTFQAWVSFRKIEECDFVIPREEAEPGELRDE